MVGGGIGAVGSVRLPGRIEGSGPLEPVEAVPAALPDVLRRPGVVEFGVVVAALAEPVGLRALGPLLLAGPRAAGPRPGNCSGSQASSGGSSAGGRSPAGGGGGVKLTGRRSRSPTAAASRSAVMAWAAPSKPSCRSRASRLPQWRQKASWREERATVGSGKVMGGSFIPLASGADTGAGWQTHRPGTGATLIRAYPARLCRRGRARIAAARFARLIARARGKRRTHLACRLNRGRSAPGRRGRDAVHGFRFPRTHHITGFPASDQKQRNIT